MRVIVRIRWDRMWPAEDGSDRFPERCTAAWQQRRWELFTRFTLPSLQRQTHDDWEAWLLADLANANWHAPMPHPRVFYVYDEKNWARDFGREAFVMRLDSDDMLAPGALAALLTAARSSTAEFAQLDTGVAWDLNARRLWYWKNPSPPFYGRAADLSEGLPDFGHHGKIRSRCEVVTTEQPMFCVLLHGGNISNNDRVWTAGILTERDRETRELFGLEPAA